MGSVSSESRTSRPIVILMGLVVAWSLFSLVRSYPAEFYPRFWDEAVYVMDVSAPGALASEYTGKMHYANFKLGYGLPLSASVSLFGDRGAMYLSTLLWALTLITLSICTYRRFGLVAGAFLAAFLAFSPFFGKYVAEASPTTLAALLFALLWIVYDRHQYLLTGLVVGLIAFVDFKWALPTALAVAVAEFVIERHRSWPSRFIHVGGVGLVAVGVLAIAALLHPPYSGWLWGYITDHSERVVFLQPTMIFAYFVSLFGAAPTSALALAGLLPGPLSHRNIARRSGSSRSLGHAIVLGGIPILFYSLLGQHKGLRFFAVTFPLLAVAASVSISGLLAWIISRQQNSKRSTRLVAGWALGVILVGFIVVGSDGPARHLRFPAGYATAVKRLAASVPREGTISSYLWPVVHYGWGVPLQIPPSTTWGILGSDKWLILDPPVDVVAHYMYEKSDVDSLMALRTVLQQGSDSIFSVPSGFYASKYFLAENAAYDATDLRSWLSRYDPAQNYATVYRINLQKLKGQTPTQ